MHNMKTILKKEVVIALSVIFTLVVLFIGIDFLRGHNIFKPANSYTAKFTNVDGLFVSSPVSINGYKVGLVHSIDYDYTNSGFVNVTIQIDQNVRLPKGTTAVLSHSLLGTATVELQLGKSKEFCELGSELPANVQVGMMDKVGEEVMPGITRLMPKLDSILTNAANITADVSKITASPELAASVKRLDDITANFDATSAALKTMSTDLQKKVPGTMTNVQELADNLNKVSQDLKELSAKLKDMPLTEAMDNVKKSTDNLARVTGQLNKSNSTLGALLNDRELYDNINNTLHDADSILIDLKKHPKKYVQFKLF